jgi:pyruvate dehydrogenase E2 component (dihydrolipoamide acetyltransferase)
MIRDVRLPEISEDVKTGEVIKVFVSKGDEVDVDQPLFELETDKAVLEVPCPYKGKVAEILVKKGDTVEVGQPILRIETGGGEKEEEARERPADAKEKKEPKEREKKPRKEPPKAARDEERQKIEEEEEEEEEEKEQKVKRERAKPSVRGLDKTRETPLPASPGVRRLARELEVDLHRVEGSGPGGRILEGDVKKSARQASAQAGRAEVGRTDEELGESDAWGPIEREPMSKVRQATARNLGRAWATVPQVTHYDKADITELEELMERHAPKVEEAGGKLTITAILLKLTASALRVFPQLNASIDVEKEEIVFKKYYHIGVAVDTDRGLIVPVVRDVDEKNVTELSVEIGTLARRAREKKIAPADLEGGTFTISNLGGIGGTAFSPIVYAPQVGILGISRARMEPVYVNGSFVPRRILPLGVTYDHRVVDGADGARFLKWIVQAIEEPFISLLEG